jgi:hypothetical protein
MKKRSHENTPRLTAKERAQGVVSVASARTPVAPARLRELLVADIEHALQAHARGTLARYKRRERDALAKHIKQLRGSSNKLIQGDEGLEST